MWPTLLCRVWCMRAACHLSLPDCSPHATYAPRSPRCRLLPLSPRPHTQYQSLSVRHPGAARTGSVASMTSPCDQHGVERWRVGLPAGPPADLCGWRSADRWCVHHRPGCHPGMHRAALRVPGGRPPRGGSHQRRDAVACRTSPLVDIGRRHCACRGEGARSGLEGLAWAGVPCGGCAPPRPPQVAALRCWSSGLLLWAVCRTTG